tara:strand:- start:2010 stop:2987 length:978 start_codon:yes stop_codon:yes gene_type:complete
LENLIPDQARLYYEMLRIRLIEEALAKKYIEQKMRCPMHLCIGQEAVPVGISSALTEEDQVFGNHRSHGYYLAKGGNLKAMIAEIYGKTTGCSGGRGGSMHLIDLKVGFLGCTSIVGGTIPLGLGAAMAAKMKGENRIIVAYFGDGCFEEGVLHESLNFASLKGLPIIFVCENNRYSVYTNLQTRQPERPMHKVAEAHGWEVNSGDGNDLEYVAEIARKAVSRIKTNERPQFLEFETHRWVEHCGHEYDDHLNYRSEVEIKSWKNRCPIKQLETKLISNSTINSEDLNSYRNTITEEIKESFKFAEASPYPSLGSLYEFSNIKPS